MTLKITLKPGEPVFIGSAKLRVVSRHTCLVLIEGNAPVLRSEDVITQEEAQNPLDRIRLALQEIYLAGDDKASRGRFSELTTSLLADQPGLAPLLYNLQDLLRRGQVYKAVKEAKSLSA